MTEETKAKIKATKEAKKNLVEGRGEENTPSEFVTKEDFNTKFESLEGSVMKLVEMMSQPQQPITPPTISIEEQNKTREINEAKTNQTEVSPVWTEKAKEILGELMDHCEVFYPKEGGTHFTVVIKTEFSNAPKDYLERMGSDRRTREISREGLEGVIKWCTLIKQNLAKK